MRTGEGGAPALLAGGRMGYQRSISNPGPESPVVPVEERRAEAAMDKYAVYVWAAYAVSGLGLLALVLRLWALRIGLMRRLRALAPGEDEARKS